MSDQRNEASICEWEGLPFRGRVTDIKKGDMPPQLDYDVHIQVLNLDKEADVKLYEDVCRKFVKGLVKLFVEERHFNDKLGCFQVFLKWADVYYRMPTKQELHRFREQMTGL
jgi:hypothetical protein